MAHVLAGSRELLPAHLTVWSLADFLVAHQYLCAFINSGKRFVMEPSSLVCDSTQLIVALFPPLLCLRS
jgi:hypothetical protein